MGETYDRLVTIFIFFVLFLLSIWVITGSTITGLSHRQVSHMASAVDDINNTIASYIQKNGGYFTDPTRREEFERALLDAHGLEGFSNNCKEHCVDIQVVPEDETLVTTTTGGRQYQRGTIFNITTSYRVYTSYFHLLGFNEGWMDAKPRTAIAKVHQYINDGNMNKR